MIDLNNQQEIADHIKKYLSQHKQFVLASVDSSGAPWAVCLNLAYDNQFNIIWKSLKSTVHSQNIKQNPTVAICVFSEDKNRGDFGIYCRAMAHEVTDENELKRLIKIRYEGKVAPPTSELSDGGSSRIYYAKISEMYFNDDRHAKTKVDLDQLRKVQK